VNDSEDKADPRFVVDSLINGEGFVIVDRWWLNPMIGPYRVKADALRRCAEVERDADTQVQ